MFWYLACIVSGKCSCMNSAIALNPRRCTLTWADDPDEANYASFVDNLPCKLSDKALPGYYNVSATVGDVFGTSEPSTPFFRIPHSQWSGANAVSSFWEPRDGVQGVHMIQVWTLPCIPCSLSHTCVKVISM
jgi:hypothetical protein